MKRKRHHHSMRTTGIAGSILAGLLLAGTLVPAPTLSQSFFNKTLRPGSRGAEVTRLQAFLKQYPSIYPEGLVTGKYGGLTRAAVKRFQKQYGLRQTGVVDRNTLNRLNDLARRFAEDGRPLSTADEPAPASPPPPPLPAAPQPIPPPPPAAPAENLPYYKYSWRAGADLTGEVNVPTPAPSPVVLLNGTRTIIPDSNAAVRLANVYHLILSDEDIPWDADSAGMLLEIMRRMPDTQFKRAEYQPWTVQLTANPLANDVEIRGRTIRLQRDAFTRSNPTLQPSADGNPDRVFYSNRLHRAVLRALFNEYDLIKEVFEKRYGVRLAIGEPADEFQNFTVDELQYLAAVFEDLPAGYRHMPGFEKIVRRRSGLTNPWSPSAAAIAWVSLGYIEFMDKAFFSGSSQYIESLVAHEASHFLWDKVLSAETRAKFTALSGWRQLSRDHWVHRTTTNFVSDYAASVDVGEDFAETMSYYIYDPDRVRSVAPDKYDFVKNIVNGYEYVLLVDEKYTFQVFNLEPDVTYPGKIMGVDIEVYRLPDGDNRILATLLLSPKFGDGAEDAGARLVSPAKTMKDIGFSPLEGDKFKLRADFTISKYAAKGYWAPEAITVRDRVDNRRYESQEQFGWMLYLDNPEEDLDAPYIDPNGVTGVVLPQGDGEALVRVTAPVTDAHTEGLKGSSRLSHIVSNQYEDGNATYNSQTKLLVYEYTLRNYRAAGVWEFRELWAKDIAGNERRLDLKEKALSLQVNTGRPDLVKPELDVSVIRITAKPRRPERPDGETDVTIAYAAKDDNAGLGWVSYTLLKPNGDILFDYHYHENFHTAYFEGGRPDEWKRYEIKLTLPPGSIPGTWILKELVLKDKAGNILTTNFVEVGILKNFPVL